MKFSHDWMSDTQPEALRVYLELNHRMPAQRKFEAVVGMYETMSATHQAQERSLHPQATEREIFLRAAARMLGPSLVKQVYGWMPGE